MNGLTLDLLLAGVEDQLEDEQPRNTLQLAANMHGNKLTSYAFDEEPFGEVRCDIHHGRRSK